MIKPQTVDTHRVSASAGPRGSVAYMVKSCGSLRTASSVGDFVRSVEPGLAVRLLIDPANAELACRLHEAGVAVEVGRPCYCNWAKAGVDARTGLYTVHVDPGRINVSLGGWHAMSQAEYAAYLLSSAVYAGDSDAAAGLLALHPAWPALSFVPHLDVARTAVVLGAIMDPRRFVDQVHPDRMSRLKCFLGLSAVAGRRSRRTSPLHAATVGAWKTSEGPPDDDAPGCFLWRRWSAAGGPSPKADAVATRLFVRFVHAAWLDAVQAVRRPTSPHRQGPMVPDLLLGDDVVGAAALDEHLRSQGL